MAPQPSESSVRSSKFRRIEKEGQVHLEDTALIVKDTDGRVRLENELDRGVEHGAVVGTLPRGFLTLAFPVAGIAHCLGRVDLAHL